jgi:hypothetical protein
LAYPLAKKSSAAKLARHEAPLPAEGDRHRRPAEVLHFIEGFAFGSLVGTSGSETAMARLDPRAHFRVHWTSPSGDSAAIAMAENQT